MSPVLEVLRAARARIESGWCQGHLATDAEGVGRSTYEPEATHFCVIGALLSSAKGGLYLASRSYVASQIDRQLDVWNDAPGRTKAEVLALFDKAIAEKEAEVTP